MNKALAVLSCLILACGPILPVANHLHPPYLPKASLPPPPLPHPPPPPPPPAGPKSVSDCQDKNCTILGEVDGSARDSVVSFLDDHKDESVTIQIISPGGSLDDGWGIVRAIEAHGQVTCKVDFMAASMAAIILQACHVRQMSPYSVIMFHRASLGGVRGKDTVFQNAADMLRVMNVAMGRFATHRSFMEFETYMRLTEGGKEIWLDSQGALAAGFIDSET